MSLEYEKITEDIIGSSFEVIQHRTTSAIGGQAELTENQITREHDKNAAQCFITGTLA
jgi:hypothetical protein